MLDAIKNWFNSNPLPGIGITTILSLLAICYLIHYRKSVAWWWLKFSYDFPLIGKIAQLSRDRRKSTQLEGWRESERVLCQDFYAYSRENLDPFDGKDNFIKYVDYLNASGDGGRKPMPIWAWFLTGLMVIAEAYAFSYILAMYQSQNISKSEQEMIAYGIAVMLSILLVAFAHFAGHELYVSSKIRYIRRQWELVDDANQHLVMHPISLEDNQKKDESEPHYNRMLNRIQNDKPHYIISIITLLLVLTVAFSAAALRWEDFSHHKAIEASETKSTGSDFDAQPALAAPVDSDDPFAAEPKAPASAEAKPAQQGNSDAGEAKATGTLIADVLLSIIFAALQVLGVILGWHWGFAGKESAVAYARLLGRRSSTYSTFEELVDDWKAIQNVAQSKLNTLQQKLNAYAHRVKMDGGVGKAHDQNNQTPKTFNDYLEMALESEKKTENIINGTTPKLITHVKESKAKK